MTGRDDGSVAGQGKEWAGAAHRVQDVPLDRIDILNPRERKQRVFQELVASIRTLGLKKPITVTPRGDPPDERYLLICGQGRVEAFRALGQATIPAMVVASSNEDAFVRSLVENIARRQPRTVEQLEAIRVLHRQGDDPAAICRKTGLDVTWIKGVLALLDKGELRLLTAVEDQRIPITTAIAIAGAGDDEVQQVLQAAYESGELRGRKLLAARRVIETRGLYGKTYDRRVAKRARTGKVSSTALVRAYNKEVERQKRLIRKADLVDQRLAFIAAALGNLLRDEHFVDLLRAESLPTLPRVIDELVRGRGA
jgi:ParB family chromosome partitioning protein